MSGPLLLFYIFSSLLLMSALMVISSPNSVRAALFLVLSFFSAAALWLLVEAEFLAIALVLVYVGAVMVLFLFVVMMIELQQPKAIRQTFIDILPLGVTIALVVLAELIIAFWKSGTFEMGFPEVVSGESNIHRLGVLLYGDYLLHFELAAMLLLVAIIAAICLAFRGRRIGTRGQEPAKQIAVKKEERLTLT